MMLGPRRFGDLKSSIKGLSANVLTQRLESLEASGIVRRRRLPPPASVQVYELTEWGLEAEPILEELGKWAARSPGHDVTAAFSPVSLMLSMRAEFQPERAVGVDVTIGFRLGEEDFFGTVRDGAVKTGRGAPDRPDAVVTTTAEMVAALFYGKVPLAELTAAGAMSVTGDAAALQRLADVYLLPPKAPVPG